MSIMTEVKNRAKKGMEKLKKSKVVNLMSDVMSYPSRTLSSSQGAISAQLANRMIAKKKLAKAGMPPEEIQKTLSKIKK